MSASTATIEERNKLSPPPGDLISLVHGDPFPTPRYKLLKSGSKTIEFHTVPPPPNSHQLVPFQVFAAISIAGSSNPKSGLPGTV